MSESEIQRIWQAINNLAQKVERLTVNIENQAELLSEVRSEIKAMATNGCSKASSHADHEGRIRELETTRNLAIGGASVIGAILGTIASWIVGKFGG